MAYKYLNALLGSTSTTPSDTYLEAFQANLDEQFYNSPDVYTIKEESVFGSNVYVDIDVRINRQINVYTGQKLGDDFKFLMFKDIAHAATVGMKYYFDNNYWLVINSEVVKNIAASCTVRRCNNVLRWVDDYGNYYTEHCSIDYEIARPRDMVGATNPVLPAGYISIYCQLNDRTRKIKGNQRFLFGNTENRICYKVFGDGVRSFLNQQTMDDNSATLLWLSVGGNFVNEDTDDLTNGIADRYKQVYTLTASASAISGSPGNVVQLDFILEKNGVAFSSPLTYLTSSSSVASFSGSGLVTLNTSGSCNLTVYMTSGSSTLVSIPVVVSGSLVLPYEIRVTPNVGYILQGETQAYSVYRYSNGVQQADAFTFAFTGSPVVNTNYTYTVVDGNNFTVSNLHKYMDSSLYVTATSGSYTKQIEIELKGAW